MAEKDVEHLKKEEPFRRVEILGGEYKTVETAALVGYCHNKDHKGFITVSIMNEHNCIEKECHYFEKFEEYPFWGKYYRKEEQKRNKKIKIQNLKENEKKRIDNLIKKEEGIKEAIYSKSKRIRNFKVTSVRKNKSSYTVFYISDKPRDDSEDFCKVALALEKTYKKQFEFIHIKTPDGKYATMSDLK